jgi:hypothetical protein
MGVTKSWAIQLLPVSEIAVNLGYGKNPDDLSAEGFRK